MVKILEKEEKIIKYLILTFPITMILCFMIFKAIGGILMSIVAAIGILYLRKLLKKDYILDEERNVMVSKSGAKGTASLMTLEDEERAFVKESNIKNMKLDILGKSQIDGKLCALAPVRYTNNNSLIIGMPGCGKSVCFVINDILQNIRRGSSVITTDSKGDIYSKTAHIARRAGYTVKVLNIVPRNLKHSDGFNPFQYIGGNELEARTLAAAIMDNTKSSFSEKEDFWYQAEYDYLLALILHETSQRNTSSDNVGFSPGTLGYMYSRLAVNDISTLWSKLRNIRPDEPGYAAAQIFLSNTDVVKSSVHSGLGIRLNLLMSNEVKRVVSNNDMDLTLPGKEKCIYYIISPDNDLSTRFITAMFFSCLFNELIYLADSRIEQKLPIPTNFILDEFYNIGKIPTFAEKLSTVRSRDMGIKIYLQNLSQLQTMYPDNIWKTIVNNCTIKILVKTNEIETAKYFSEETGKMTVVTKGKKYNKHATDLTDIKLSYSVTESITDRNVLTSDEVKRLDGEEVLVLVAGHQAVKLDKYPYFEHPYAKLIVPLQANKYLSESQKVKIEREKAIEHEINKQHHKDKENVGDLDTQNKDNHK